MKRVASEPKDGRHDIRKLNLEIAHLTLLPEHSRRNGECSNDGKQAAPKSSQGASAFLVVPPHLAFLVVFARIEFYFDSPGATEVDFLNRRPTNRTLREIKAANQA